MKRRGAKSAEIAALVFSASIASRRLDWSGECGEAGREMKRGDAMEAEMAHEERER
jgi:hypothetical protein